MLVYSAAQLMVSSVLLFVTTASHVIKFFHQLYSSSQSDMVQPDDVIIQSTDMAPPDDVITQWSDVVRFVKTDEKEKYTNHNF